jgi:putative intracellular protease/amidase
MKILMVLTSDDRLRDTGKKTGFWLEEFAAPYYVFEEAGAHLTLASPKGGQPPIDPRSELPNAQTGASRLLLSSAEIACIDAAFPRGPRRAPPML